MKPLQKMESSEQLNQRIKEAMEVSELQERVREALVEPAMSINASDFKSKMKGLADGQ